MLNKDLQEIEKINNILNKNDKKLQDIIKNQYTIIKAEVEKLKFEKLTFIEFWESVEFKKINDSMKKTEEKEKIIKNFNKVLENNKYILIEKILLNEVLKMEVLKKYNNKKIEEKEKQKIKDNFKNVIEPFLKAFNLKYDIYLYLKSKNHSNDIEFMSSCSTLNIKLKDDYFNLNNFIVLVETRQKELEKKYISNSYRCVLNSFKNEKLLKKLEKEKELIEEKIYNLKKEIVKY